MIFGPRLLYLLPSWINFGPDDVDKNFFSDLGLTKFCAVKTLTSVTSHINCPILGEVGYNQSASNEVKRLWESSKLVRRNPHISLWAQKQ